MFTASKAKMGEFIAPRWLTVMAALIAVVVVTLNMKLLIDFVIG
jgi:manganese transport protein